MNKSVNDQITISAWNVHGLGDKMEDELFTGRIKNDINILLETWKGENKELTIPGFNTISKVRKKKKRSKRYSGGIIIFYKKSIKKGLTYIKNGTSSNNRLWMKLDKTFFGLENDIYLCAIYIPPITSNHYDNDFINLEREINNFSNKGKIILLGDFNSRTGNSPDYIQNDSKDINNFTNSNLLPDNYQIDKCFKRLSCDKVTNSQGNNLLDLCISSQLRILNGRYFGDILGNYTCMTSNGFSAVDYGIVSEGLLSSVKYFKTYDFNYLSDHTQIEIFLKSNWNIQNYNIFNENDWTKSILYKWDPQKSKTKLINILSEKSTIDSIVNFELQNFSEDQKGVDEATNEITKILDILSENSCQVIKKNFYKKSKRKKKQSWSDNSVTELKHQINALGREITKNPYDNSYKVRYFTLLKN